MKKICFLILLVFVAACHQNISSKEFWIENAQGEGLFVKTEGLKNSSFRKVAILQHGLASNKEHQAIQAAKRAFLDNQYVVISFDARYSLGEGNNEVEKVRLSTFYDDLKTVADWAKNQDFYQGKFALAGHSLGGATVIKYAAEHPEEVSILVPIAPVLSGEQWEKSCMTNMTEFCDKWKQTGVYTYTDKHNLKTALIPYAVITSCKGYDAKKLASQIKAQTLLIGAEKDIVTSEEDIKETAQLMPNGQAIIVDSSSHNFESEQNQTGIYQAIDAFLE